MSERVREEIKARRLAIVGPDDAIRIVLEVSSEGEPDNSDEVQVPRVTLFDARGRPTMVLEIDTRDKPRIRVGDPRGSMTEVEAGLLLVGLRGNTRAMLLARDDGGVLHLCDEDGSPVAQLPSDR